MSQRYIRDIKMSNFPWEYGDPPSDPPNDIRSIAIGISLSGGGYRAAAFHLGTLAYLHHVNILPQLRRLSTVSGGTFTGAKYILSLVEETEFSVFFRDFYLFLLNGKLFDKSLTDFRDSKEKSTLVQRKLITSMANTYADTFMKSSKGEPYTLGHIFDSQIHVDEVVFNSTEFRSGIAFRFQKSKSPDVQCGNGNMRIPKEDSENIRMADVVAASSCFPGAFEPLEFPQDFVWPNNQTPKAVQDVISKDEKFKSIALMDGGIFDNQGIDSLLLADKRTNADKLDLIIISDVDAVKEELFAYPEKKKSQEVSNGLEASWLFRRSLKQIYLLLRIIWVTCVLTVLSIIFEIFSEIQNGTFVIWQDLFLALIPLSLVILITACLWWGRKFIYSLLKRIPQAKQAGWNDLKNLTLAELLYLLELRYKSLEALITAIFMRRIKDLIFKRTFDDKQYRGKRISNRIDRLISRSTTLPGISPSTDILKDVISAAVDVPTTLWFDNDKQLKDLTIAGQATICFNLMQYIVRYYGEEPKEYPAEIQNLWLEMQKDWDSFNLDPSSLLKAAHPDMEQILNR